MEATHENVETMVPSVEKETNATENEKTTMKIWIAVDDSDGSFYALKWALQHLFLQHDATITDHEPLFTVTVIHVQPPFQPNYTATPVGPLLFTTSGMRESVAKAGEESGVKILARAQELCDQHKVVFLS
ncbi:uncharacterized protein [Rutidosis leptorrhynchoides]|uniref:uncharacterized protein n=1 Tax=Rutidosis leptorrhynchoides TaxID=125765 RepID=UPI003A993598